MKLIQTLIILCTSIASYANAPADSIKVLDFKPYKINYPSSWRLKENCTAKECSIIAPFDTLSKTYDTYGESINLTFSNLPSAEYTVDKYAQFSIDYLPKVVKDFKVLEKKKIKPNVIRIVYTGEKNTFKQTWRQYYYVRGGKVYIVTFSAETAKYDYYQPFIEPYLNSFMLK